MGITIDGTDVQDITIDGTAVQEVTIDGSVVWVAKTIIDDFEDNDLAEYGGDTGNFDIQTSTVAEGTYALEATSAGRIGSDSGLPNYPQQGDTWKINVRYTDGGAQPNVWWCVDFSGGNLGGIHPGYYFGIDQSNNNFNIWEYDGSNYNRFILVQGVGGHVGEWLTVEISHNTDDSMDVALKSFDESTTYGSGSGTPSNLFRSSGGIQFRKRGSGTQYFDDWRIV